MKFRIIIQTIGSQMGLEDKLNFICNFKPIIEAIGRLTRLTLESGDLYIRTDIINTITVTVEK